MGLAFLVVVCGCAAATSDPQSPWREFLREPNEQGLSVLSRKVSGCVPDDPCAARVTPTNDEVVKLVRLIESGSAPAVQAGLLCRRFTGGGNLEDISRAIGSIVARLPRVFLMAAKQNAEPDKSIGLMAVQLPLDSVDNLAVQKKLLDERINILSAVEDVALERERSAALSRLKAERAAVDRVTD